MSSRPKIVIIGAGGVGKTTYVERLMNGNFDPKYTATLGVDVNVLQILSTLIVVWDCAGQEKFKGLGDGYYTNANGFIIMCDDSKISQKIAREEYEYLNRKYPQIPKVLCCNKVDIVECTMSDFIPISVKKNMNMYKPILHLIKA